MPNRLLGLLTGVAVALLTGGTALASNNKAMDADIHSIELQWEHIKFTETGSPHQFTHIDTLAKYAASVAKKYPNRVEPLDLGGYRDQRGGGHGGHHERHGLREESESYPRGGL